MYEQSENGDAVGCPALGSNFEDLLCEGRPEETVGVGKVAAFVFESADGVLAFGSYVSIHKKY